MQQRHAHRVLALERRGEGDLVGHAHRLDRFQRGDRAALLLCKQRLVLVEDLRFVELCCQFTRAAQRPPLLQQPLGKFERRRLELRTGEHLLEKTELQRLRSAQFLALGDHAQCCARADEPWQALRPAGARDDAQPHFRKAEPRVGERDAEMAGQRQLQSATERGAVDRGEDGLGVRLDALHDLA
jgi:hypothetical protein